MGFDNWFNRHVPESEFRIVPIAMREAFRELAEAAWIEAREQLREETGNYNA